MYELLFLTPLPFKLYLMIINYQQLSGSSCALDFLFIYDVHHLK